MCKWKVNKEDPILAPNTVNRLPANHTPDTQRDKQSSVHTFTPMSNLEEPINLLSINPVTSKPYPHQAIWEH